MEKTWEDMCQKSAWWDAAASSAVAAVLLLVIYGGYFLATCWGSRRIVRSG